MARAWIGVAGVVLASACSGEKRGPSAGPAAALEETTGAPWIVEGDPPTFAFAKKPARLPDGGSVDVRALAFLDRVKAALRMNDPQSDYRVRETVTAPGGSVHVRLQQVIDGVDVEGRTWVVNVRDEAVTSMGGSYLAPPPHESGVQVDLEAATKIARRAFASERGVSEADASTVVTRPELAYVSVGAALRLAWAVSAYASADVEPSTGYWVDAITGAVLASWSNAVAATARGYGSRSNLVSFPVSSPRLPSFTDAVVQVGEGVDDTVRIFTGGPDARAVSALRLEPWTDALVPSGMAVDGQFHLNAVARFFAKLERNQKPYLSYDGQGAPLVAIVGADTELARSNGAYWETTTKRLILSRGNPSGSEGYYPNSASLETFTHEMTHGVSFATWLKGLSNPDARSLETRALNEHVGDVFAALLTHETGADDASAFLFSEDDNALNDPWRSLVYPKQRNLAHPGDPVHCDHTSELHAGTCQAEAHRAAGIPNHAFYLMTHGGLSAHEETDESGTWRVRVPCGVGWGNAKSLYWDLLSARMKPSEDFRQMALDSLDAARDLDIDNAPIVCAWAGVGVLSMKEASETWGVTCEKAFSAASQEHPEDLANEQTGAGKLLLVPSQPLLVCSGVSLIAK